MKFCVLGSGSQGNATYFETNKLKCLIDFGTSNMYTTTKLKSFGIEANDINCVFITHEHIDHIGGLKVFLRKNDPTIFVTKKLYDILKDELAIEKYVILNDITYLEDLKISTLKTSHDSKDSVGFVFETAEESIVYITDTGYINAKYHQLLLNKTAYIIESNHDVNMLMNGSYPYHIKQRILGDRGHLSNESCSKYLKTFVGERTKYIFLAHISDKNNTKEMALETAKTILKNENIKIEVTNQSNPSKMVKI